MSIMGTAAVVIGGAFDAFDRASGIADHLLETMDKLEKLGELDMDIEFHAPTLLTDAHLFDPAAEARLQLMHAKELIREACDICQNISAAI